MLTLYGDKVNGVLSGWDRIRFRGTIRWLASAKGLGSYLGNHGLLLKDFGDWANALTLKIRQACALQAEKLGIPIKYEKRSGVDKNEWAHQIARERGVDTGDICMFSVLETCIAPLIKGNRATQKLELYMGTRKCVFIYHYWNDPVLGFGHTRLQTWLPFSATICINGRHWLERQLLQEEIDYMKDGNCFPYIANMARAQQLLDEQLQVNWPKLLNGLVARHCPVLHSLFGRTPLDYYWSADETEWASDILFRSTTDLDRLIPSLVRFGLVSAQSPVVLRFLGRKVSGATIRGRLPDEITSDVKHRYEGVRLKHWVNKNSLKAYNKAGNSFRLEATINNTRDFKVFRHPDDDKRRPASWQKMRKGVSDLHRRAQVSQACNQRYAEHLAAAFSSETLQPCAADISSRIRQNGRTYRALNPWAVDDFKMLQFVSRGENQINGFRNRDLRQCLYPASATETSLVEVRKASGRVTRKIQILRAHGLVRKVSRTTRYVLTPKGQKIITAILAASAADIQRLMEKTA